jgi:hypothetical protein
MVIKARFTEGVTSVTTKSLYQWDYGQKLEIESADLPAMFEVHFACQGMKEAAVVPCSATDGVGVVTIPNKCLEQSSPITAWVYEIYGETGSTTKVINIPVVQRVRPSGNEDVPQHIEDKYTEVISLLNEAMNSLRDGTTVVAKAAAAEAAEYAASAGNAQTATQAQTAVQANNAMLAQQSIMGMKAIQARELCDAIYHETFAEPVTSVTIPVDRGLYMFVLVDQGGLPRMQMIYTGGATPYAVTSDMACVYSRSNSTILVQSSDFRGITEIFRVFNSDNPLVDG